MRAYSLGVVSRGPFATNISVDLDGMCLAVSALGRDAEVGKWQRSTGQVGGFDRREERRSDLDGTGGQDENGRGRRNLHEHK